MTDRCFVRVHIRPSDRERFEAIGFRDELTAVDPSAMITGAITLVDAEAAYGYYEALIELARLKVPFLSYSEPCPGEPAISVVCDGDSWCAVDTLVYGGLPAINIGSDGFVEEKVLKNARKYHAALANLRKLLGPTVRVSPWSDIHKMLEEVDGPAFRDQRSTLYRLVEATEEGVLEDPGLDWGVVHEHLSGLENFLDDLAYYMHDHLEKDCLFKPKEEE